MDLIRNILLKIEDRDKGKNEDVDIKIDGVEPHIVSAHVRLLKEAGLLDAYEIPDCSEVFDYFIPTRLTWSGHEYLDLVRDPEVWRRTKAAAAKMEGAGIELMWAFAKAYGKQLVKEKTGIDL